MSTQELNQLTWLMEHQQHTFIRPLELKHCTSVRPMELKLPT